MRTTPVIACATSRLHADIMLIRLRRENIKCGDISAFSPQHSIPNAVACWLRMDGQHSLQIGQEEITAAGRLSSKFQLRSDEADLIRVFRELGVGPAAAELLKERLDQGHTLLCVSARSGKDVEVARDVFEQAAADLIVVGAESIPANHAADLRARIPADFPAWAHAAA